MNAIVTIPPKLLAVLSRRERIGMRCWNSKLPWGCDTPPVKRSQRFAISPRKANDSATEPHGKRYRIWPQGTHPRPRSP